MKLAHSILLTLPFLALVGTHARDAEACGGCFVQQSESTQVTGHRMILSSSSVATTLWDQISYAGDPAEFAWVLPTKGVVEIGLSSDALFESLEQYTAVTVASPQITCPPPPSCGNDFAGGSTGTSGAGGGGGGVDVIASEVVGPFETVQLSSSDPAALSAWLASHNYNVPADIQPIIDAYVGEGFNFLALKLVPGQGIDSMRPVRVTSPGAGATLPLRMVAAGTGATTAVSLWMMGEGRYEPSNFPSFTIDPAAIVWDWDAQASNYKALRQQGFDASNGLGFIIEAAEPFPSYDLEYVLASLVEYDLENSGYADEDGLGATEALQADLGALFNGIDRSSLWATRMYGELPRVALDTDLDLGASADQSIVQRYFQATTSVGTPPPCPEFPPCDDLTTSTSGGDTSGSSGAGGANGSGGAGADGTEVIETGGCTVGGTGGAGSAAFGAGLLLALSALRRRRAPR